MATVYLHMATPRTGTTAIQQFLSDNNKLLKKYGICYPDLGFCSSKTDALNNAHFLLESPGGENSRQDCPLDGKHYEHGLDQLADLAKNYDKIIISDEEIWQNCWKQNTFWTKLKYDIWMRSLDIKLIIYLRRQDLCVPVLWKEELNKGSTLDFHESLLCMKDTGCLMNYFKYIEMLASVFGEKSLIIRVYEKGQFHGTEHTLFSDFLDIFGLSLQEGFTAGQEPQDESPEGNYAEIRRILNAIPGLDKPGHILKKSILDAQKLYPDHNDCYTWRTPDEQQKYLSGFAVSNENLARKYLHRSDGILFYDGQIEDFSPKAADEQTLIQDMLHVYGYAIHLLEQENQDLKKELDNMATRIEGLKKDGVLDNVKRFVRHVLGKDKPANAKN